ncbi:dormancy-associated protein homolog 3-like isoform X1 [Hibiscus syriacus]|uniref:dormancy-associated protein homolog 3-like isoform X1 n=1 Tax=Hibiscus syriacus TaxID=106335 RepID=UPI001922475C|nr:dormancy-associated protein homolog 3-like isoform X1 [Hibiscus syriacus]
MGLLDQLWDDIIAGPPPDNGLGKLRKYTFRRPNSAKESDGGSGRSYGDETSLEEAMRVTRTIMIVKPPGYQIGSPPVSPSGSSPPASPAGTSPPVSPFSGKKKQRVISVSKKIDGGYGQEDRAGWTRELSSCLQRARYEMNQLCG